MWNSHWGKNPPNPLCACVRVCVSVSVCAWCEKIEIKKLIFIY